MMSLPAAGAAFALADRFLPEAAPARAQQMDPLQGHFHPKGKPPSKFTLDVIEQAKAPTVRRHARFRGAGEGLHRAYERPQDHGYRQAPPMTTVAVE